MGLQVRGVLGPQAEDADRDDERQADEEQEWQDCLEGFVGEGQEGLLLERHQGLGGRSEGGAEGAWPDWLRAYRRQVGGWQGPLRQGQVHLGIVRRWSAEAGFFFRRRL